MDFWRKGRSDAADDAIELWDYLHLIRGLSDEHLENRARIRFGPPRARAEVRICELELAWRRQVDGLFR